MEWLPVKVLLITPAFVKVPLFFCIFLDKLRIPHPALTKIPPDSIKMPVAVPAPVKLKLPVLLNVELASWR